ncbi:MAG TPA: hypothetical protein VM537_05745 [Anaerolineae bacterium]|nr:hypothetical protein [Anaerolineae bacterium]
MRDMVLQTIQDQCGFVLQRYMEGIGFRHQGGCEVNGESTGRFVRGDEHLRLRFRVEEVASEDRIADSRTGG